jgi:pantetheine-phosphate adenylyltransferase
MKKAIFPGSFDPFTIGHVSIVTRGLELFDEVVIAIGENSTKSSYFSIEQRFEWIEKIFANQPKVSVKRYKGLTINFCKAQNATYLLRGLRSALDFEYESKIAHTNRVMFPELETVFLLAVPEHSHINSSIIREIIKNNGDVSPFVPSVVNNDLK